MKILLYIFAFIFCFRFMGVLEVPSTTMSICFMLMGFLNYKKGLLFNKYIILIFVFLLLNFFSCLYFNGQTLLDSFRASNEFYSLSLFWFFYSWNLDLKRWEKTLWWLCLCFGLCYIIQYITFPNIIFGGQIRTGSEEQRMALYGQGLASFSVIFGLNKYLTTNKMKYIAIVLTGIFAVFGCGYRTMLLALIISLLLMIMKLGISKRIIISFSIISIVLYFFLNNADLIQSQFANMMGRQEKLDEQGFENNIRYINLIYHYTEYFKNPIELFLGSGMPFKESAYGDYQSSIMIDTYGFYYADWGLIGLSWMIGIPAVLIMLLYSYRIFRTKVPKEYLYIGIYFFNIVISSITTHEFYIHQNYVVQAILFCVFMKILENCKPSLYAFKGGRRRNTTKMMKTTLYSRF